VVWLEPWKSLPIKYALAFRETMAIIVVIGRIWIKQRTIATFQDWSITTFVSSLPPCLKDPNHVKFINDMPIFLKKTLERAHLDGSEGFGARTGLQLGSSFPETALPSSGLEVA